MVKKSKTLKKKPKKSFSSSASEKTREFVQIVQDALEIQPKEVVNVTQALGRVLAADVRARHTSPHKDMAAIDGYAANVMDLIQIPTTLIVAGESRAGKPFLSELQEGQAVKVFAGARVPVGANVVVPKEHVEEVESHIIVNEEIPRGEFICQAGIDFSENERVLREGNTIAARDIGLAAAMKVSWLPVRRKPRVAVLAIGDELAMLGDVTEGARITSSSDLVLCAFIQACGAVPINLGLAADSPLSVDTLAEAAEGADLLVTTGGLSASADNLLRKALSSKGSKFEEITLALSKKESVLFGKRDRVPVLSFPGNPISAQICATLFLRPAIDKMLDMQEELHKKNHAVLGRQLDVNDVKMDYTFARLMEAEDKQLVADPASSQDRLLFSALAEADCLITVDRDNLERGSQVEITRFTCSVISG